MTLSYEKLKHVFMLLQEAMSDLESQALQLAQKDQEITALKASLAQLQTIRTSEASPNGHSAPVVETER